MADFDGMLAAAAGLTPAPVPTSAPDADPMAGIPFMAPAAPAPIDVPTMRRNEVATVAEDKRVALGGHPSPEVFRNAAIARATGSGRASASGIEQDLATLPYEQIFQKYGEQADGLILELTAAQASVARKAATSRSNSEAVRDTGIGVASGLANSLLGIGALGVGAVNNKAGVYVAEKLAEANKWVESTQSPALQMRREANQEQNALDQRDSTAQFEKDTETYGAFAAGLKRIGTDAVNAVANVVKDPTLLSDGVAQAVGSVVAAGPATKALAAVGKAALGAKLSPTAATSLAIGAMESGGTYVDTVNSLTAMSHEDLLKRSPSYARMIQEGWDPADAKANVINRTALLGAAATAPAAVAAGRLVAKFEGNPLHVPSAKGAVGNLVREGVEEGAQGATGQLSQNLAVQNIADNTRTLSEGVGEQVGLGALYGVGAAGALQAPGLAKRGALAAVATAGTAALKAMTDAAEGRRARNEAKSPVSPAILDKASEEAVQAAPEAATVLKEAVDNSSATPELKQAATEAADRIVGAMVVTPEEIASLPGSVQSIAEGVPHRYGLVKQLATQLAAPENPAADVTDPAHPERRLEMAQAFLKTVQPLIDATQGNSEVFDSFAKGSVEQMILSRFQGLMANIRVNENIRSAVTQAEKSLTEAQSNGRIQPVTEKSLESAQGVQNAELAIMAASVDPAKADPVSIGLMVQMATAGKLKLTAAQYAALLGVEAILSASNKAREEQNKLGHVTPVSDIADQIITGKNESYTHGTKTDNDRLSARGHATNVFRAMQAQNPEAATEYMEGLHKFVTHMQNKLGAIASETSGEKRKPFRAYNPELDKWYDTGAPVIHLHNPVSVELGQRQALETQRLTEIYNNLAKAFPALGAKPFAVPSMPKALQGKVSVVVARNARGSVPTKTTQDTSSSGSTSQTTTTPPANNTPNPAPAPKVTSTPAPIKVTETQKTTASVAKVEAKPTAAPPESNRLPKASRSRRLVLRSRRL